MAKQPKQVIVMFRQTGSNFLPGFSPLWYDLRPYNVAYVEMTQEINPEKPKINFDKLKAMYAAGVIIVRTQESEKVRTILAELSGWPVVIDTKPLSDLEQKVLSILEKTNPAIKELPQSQSKTA